VNSLANQTISNDRLTGYLKVLRRIQVDFDPSLVFNAQNSVDSGRQVAELIIRRGLEATALVVESDLTAKGIFEVFHEQGVRIPEDASIVSLGSDTAYLTLSPILTTALQDYALLGETAVELLNDMLADTPNNGRQVVIDSVIREGGSCLSR